MIFDRDDVLFRGFNERNKWTEGLYIKKPHPLSKFEHYIVRYDFQIHGEYVPTYTKVENFTIGRFTGFTLEKRIFEDDILHWRGEDVRNPGERIDVYLVILYEEGCFWAMDTRYDSKVLLKDIMNYNPEYEELKIQTNIHDTPDWRNL